LTAPDGRRGVELAIGHEPDLILMDVIMPEMTGFEAIRRIRKQPALRHTPIIMVTTRGESANVAEGFAAGCTAYITKPFNANDLLEMILASLERDDAITDALGRQP
jgi:CheY-like chemotaxis protein